jgi:hypothetical protein
MSSEGLHVWRWPLSDMLRHVVWYKFTKVSEEADISETSVKIQIVYAAEHHRSRFHTCCLENLKSHRLQACFLHFVLDMGKMATAGKKPVHSDCRAGTQLLPNSERYLSQLSTNRSPNETDTWTVADILAVVLHLDVLRLACVLPALCRHSAAVLLAVFAYLLSTSLTLSVPSLLQVEHRKPYPSCNMWHTTTCAFKIVQREFAFKFVNEFVTGQEQCGFWKGARVLVAYL